MKKLGIMFVFLIMMCYLCSCGGNDVRYDAVYDTQTKQYIALGDSKDDIEIIIGEGKVQNGKSSLAVGYESGLRIFYDADNTAKEINVYNYDILSEDENKIPVESRYVFFGNLQCGMSGTEVKKNYPQIKAFDEFMGVKCTDDTMKDNRYLSISYDSMSDKSSYSYDYTNDTDAFLDISFEKGQINHIVIYKWGYDRKKENPPPEDDK